VNKTASVVTAAFLALTVVGAASAQTRPATDPSHQRTEAQRQRWAPEPGAFESSKLMGMKVRAGQNNKDAGEISQLVIDQSGKVTHVIIGKGGVLGVGENRVVVPWSDVKISPDPANRNRWVAMVDQAKLDSAPRYEARRDTAPAASPSSSTPGSSKY
jgi:sporulation protein YlmC with PRC-barrel domain